MNALIEDPALYTRNSIDGAKWIPTTLFEPSPTNPRRLFDEKGLQEMAASLKAHGQIAPILARPNPRHTGSNGRPPYEIVAGERRWRGAGLGGIEHLMALVRDMTDFEVLEVQLIENLQRTDLHSLEEAEGYAALLSQPGKLQGYASREELADRIGKSASYVHQRLKLCELGEDGRRALLEGKIGTTVAVLIARLPSHEQQAEATAMIVRGFGGEPFSYRSAADYLQKTFMLRLEKAPFDTGATYTVAGPCGQCPKRSGANPGLFDDVTGGDMCQDRTCFDTKTEEAHQAALQTARDAGHQVIAGDEARALLPSVQGQPVGHQFFNKPCPAFTDSKKPLRELLGLNFKGVVVLDHPISETAIAIVPDDKVRRALKAKDLLREPAAPAATAKGQGALTDEASATPKAAAPAPRPMTQQQASQATARRAAEQYGHLLFKQLHSKIGEGDLPVAGLRLALGLLLDSVSAEGLQLIYQAQGWQVPGVFGVDLRIRIAAADARLLGQLLIEATYADYCVECSSRESIEDTAADQMAQHYAIDTDSLMAEAVAEAEAYVTAEQQRRGLPPPPATPETALVNALKPALKPAIKTAQPIKTAPAVKYRCAATGSTWSGRGLHPKWLKVALERGAKLADFAL
jgi:ParB/RepB/Spo0J family partition protein